VRDTRDPRDAARDGPRDVRDPRNHRDPRDMRDNRGPIEPLRDARGPRDGPRNPGNAGDRAPAHDVRNGRNDGPPPERPSPEKRVELMPSRPSGPADTPTKPDDASARPAPRGLPERPAASPATGERIIEAPRSTRSADVSSFSSPLFCEISSWQPARGVTNGNGIQIARHGLPNRPAPSDGPRPTRPLTPPRPSGGDLLSRMSGSGTGGAQNRPEQSRQDSTPRAPPSQPREDSRPKDRDNTPQATRDDRSTPDPRKRPHEGTLHIMHTDSLLTRQKSRVREGRHLLR
jgi:hypothetical protein